MTDAGDAVTHKTSDRGMASLAPGDFEAALLDLIDDWLAPATTTPILACGMVGARQGWTEAPYRSVPCVPLDALQYVRAPALDPRLDVRIVPGLNQLEPMDVMRGEETQIAGYLAAQDNFEGTLCLPGTHTKWVEVAAGEVRSFKTMMTGELFALLAEQSVLRHSVGQGWDDDAFDSALARVYAQPSSLVAQLFPLRAKSLLADLAPASARSALSGMLIGAELAAAPLGSGAVVLIGSDDLAGLYARALKTLGQEVTVVDGEEVTLMGLRRAKAMLAETAS